MYSILDRYIGKVFLYNVMITLMVLISLSGIIRFIDELRKIGQGNYFILEIGVYILLSVIKDIEFFLPVAIFLGALFGLSLFAVRNELIVMEVFGFSRVRIVFSLIKIIFPVILFGMFINEWIVPISECTARNYRYRMMNNDAFDFSGYTNLWIKDGSGMVYIERVVQYDHLLGIHIYHFSVDKKLQLFRYATSAKFVGNTWNLFDVSMLYFSDSMNFVEKKSISDVWLTSITPNHLSIIIRSVYHSTVLSIFDLYRCILFFKKNGGEVIRYQLVFWKKIFFPISVIVMMLVALSYIFKLFFRKLNFGIQILIGVIYSFFFIL